MGVPRQRQLCVEAQHCTTATAGWWWQCLYDKPCRASLPQGRTRQGGTPGARDKRSRGWDGFAGGCCKIDGSSSLLPGLLASACVAFASCTTAFRISSTPQPHGGPSAAGPHTQTHGSNICSKRRAEIRQWRTHYGPCASGHAQSAALRTPVLILRAVAVPAPQPGPQPHPHPHMRARTTAQQQTLPRPWLRA